MLNPDCSGAGPHGTNPQVRVLPTGGDSNAILCKACFYREMGYRRQRNFDAGEALFNGDLSWQNLEVYYPGPARTVCCICEAVIKVHAEHGRDSHGLCPACLTEELAKAKLTLRKGVVS